MISFVIRLQEGSGFMKILIIEDDAIIRQELSAFLTKNGYECESIENFEDVFNQIEIASPHLILLDLGLPFHDGYYICRKLREQTQVPIIIITSRDTEMDELMSMNLGADDFVRKPFNTQILLLRMERLLQRTYDKDSQALSDGDLTLDLSKGIVSHKGISEELTKNEIAILYYFFTHKGNIVTREDLMTYLWSTDTFVDDNTLSVNISRLRKKLELLGVSDPFQTKRGIGYIME